MKNICIFGGPGVGKSTISSGLFYEMKRLNYNVEYLTEFAKELVFSKAEYQLKDQLFVLANQHHPWFKLEDQIDYTINDGPFLLGIVYLQESKHIPKEQFENLVISMYKSWDTINIFLERDEKDFETFGRVHDYNQSVILDNKILKLLEDNNIKYNKIKLNNAVNEILKLI